MKHLNVAFIALLTLGLTAPAFAHGGQHKAQHHHNLAHHTQHKTQHHPRTAPQLQVQTNTTKTPDAQFKHDQIKHDQNKPHHLAYLKQRGTQKDTHRKGTKGTQKHQNKQGTNQAKPHHPKHAHQR